MLRPARRPARAAALLALAAVATVAPPAAGRPAQATPEPAPAGEVPADPPAPSPDEEVRERRRALQDELTAAKRALDEATAGGDSAPDALVRSAETLERIDRTFERQLAQLARLAEQDAAAERWEQERRALAATPGAVVDATFLDLEALRAERAAAALREKALGDAVEAAQAAVDRARREQEERETERRRLREELERAPEGERETAAAALARAEREARLAAEVLRLRRWERDAAAAEARAHALQIEVLDERVRRMERSVRFTAADLATRLDEVAKEEFALSARRDSARLDLEMATRRLSDARDRRDRAADAGPASAEEVEAYRQARETRQAEVARLDERIEARTRERELWHRRFEVANEPPDARTLRTWAQETATALEQLERTAGLLRTEIDADGRSIASIEQRLASDPEPDVARWLREQARHVQGRIRATEAARRDLEGVADVARKLRDELGAETDTASWTERWESFRSNVERAWGYEITSIDDRPITVAKVVIGFLLLLLGVSGAKLASRVIGRRLLPRFGVTEGGGAAVQTIIFYLLVVTVFLLALRVVNVPLTAFTILGGAFAIGVGFGSQNLMNNFISGLILLVERPIRVGDLIQVGDLLGIVERIGARSTLIRKPSNVDIIVPNSTFLESNVINWTLSDDTYRTWVSVGVVYGSPLREVSKLLRKAVDEHGLVLKSPEPTLLFTEFGDDALLFEIHFWIRMRREMDRRRVESDIRFRIDGLFREAGIVIAFPQRDVHLDTTRPLQVRVAPAEGDEAEEA